MKKIISVVLVVLALTLGIVGCTDKKVTLSQEEQMYYTTYTQKIVQTLSLMTEDNFAELRSLPELEMDLTLRQGFGIPVEATEFLEIMNAWESAEQECGELNLQKNYSFTFEENSDGIVVAFEGDFEKRDATITVQFNENEFITSMDVSAHFSRGEILEKAGLNTVLGMGVVFSVLVFLALVIGLLKYVPKIVGNGKNEEVKTVIEDVIEEAEESCVIECTDDLELVAVITAAIAAQEGTTTDGFVVRSIRRRPSNRW